jgi:outer membrane protein OmpA-like peptidoglycan-associated protein/YHS domain-containing protein
MPNYKEVKPLKNMRRILLFGLLLSLTQLLSAQTYTTVKTANKKAVKLYEQSVQQSFNKQLKGALSDAERALELEPNFIDAHLQWARIQYDLGNVEKAKVGFLKVVALDADYSNNTLYNLGLINAKLKKYDQAVLYFQRYLNSDAKSTKMREKTAGHLKSNAFLAEAVKTPMPFEPVNLGLNVNNQLDQYLPSLTADGNTLIYSVFKGSRVNGNEDFYVSKRVDGEWQLGKPVSGVNTPESEGAQSLSPDGRFLVFTACGRKGGAGKCDLYFTENVCGEWTKVEMLPSPISTGAWESQPSISSDGKTLYFSSDRKGSRGGKDLWSATRNTDGSWSVPKNLGTKINSKGHEKAPFIHADGQTLYFLSMGHAGMGEEDVFMARKQLDGTWGEPKNLGYPINTTSSEGPIIVSIDGKTAYFSTNRNDYEGAQGKMDIYSFEMAKSLRPQPVTYVKAKVKDDDSGKALSASVEIIDLETGKILSKSKSDCEGEFVITLPIGKNYMMNVSKDGYLFHSENFALTEKKKIAEPFLLKIDLISIPEDLANTGETAKPKSKPIILNNVFFETGSAALRQLSMLELNRLKNLLEANASLKIQINGHTDNVGEQAANLELSTNRAKTVYNYLIENGIAVNRLNFKGFGESESIATNTTPEGRQKNRRTEFVIL